MHEIIKRPRYSVKKYQAILVLFALVFLNSCSLWPSDEDEKSSYKINFIHDNWQEIPPEDSDRAFLNNTNGNIILANSFCDKYQETSLPTLAKRALTDISKQNILEEKHFTFKERDAYLVYMQGRIDGVAMYLQLVNYRRDNCYYDFLYISQYQIKSNHEKIFNIFLDSIEF